MVPTSVPPATAEVIMIWHICILAALVLAGLSGSFQRLETTH